MLKNGFCRADTDGLVYRAEDTYWLCPPATLEDPHDPGVLDAKAGAVPVSKDVYEVKQEEN